MKCHGLRLLLLWFFVIKGVDGWKISSLLGEIKPEPDHETVGDFDADELGRGISPERIGLE